MRKHLLSAFALVLLAGAALISCKKDETSGEGNGNHPATNAKYVLLTAEWVVSDGSGYYAAYNEVPAGEVDNIGGYSLQSRNYGGFRTFKNWMFNRQRLSGETGIVRYGIGANGKFEETGFIKCGTSAQHLEVDETTCGPERLVPVRWGKILPEPDVG